MDTFKKEYQDSKYVLTIGINNICHYFSDDTTTNWTASSEYCKIYGPLACIINDIYPVDTIQGHI